MALKTLDTSALNRYDGASKTIMLETVQVRVDYLLKRIDELPKEIEEKKVELNAYREELSDLRSPVFSGLRFTRDDDV